MFKDAGIVWVFAGLVLATLIAATVLAAGGTPLPPNTAETLYSIYSQSYLVAWP